MTIRPALSHPIPPSLVLPLRKNPFQPFISAGSVQKRLRDSASSYYLGDENVSTIGRFEGHVLIVDAESGPSTEMVLCGAFGIDPRSFCMSPPEDFGAFDGGPCSIYDVEAHCRLVPVLQYPEFNFSVADFPAVCRNIRSLQEKVLATEFDRVTSVLVRLAGGDGCQPFTSIKLMHAIHPVGYRPISSGVYGS
jgi:hypothetical protein